VCVCVCVCVCARVLLWRWLGKRCHMSYHYNVIPQFRELFDCPSYCTHTNNVVCTYLIYKEIHSWEGNIRSEVQVTPSRRSARLGATPHISS
jgi:hypothetical protein